MFARRLILLCLFAANFGYAEQPPMLQDQYGNSGGLGNFTGEAVLAIVASPQKLRWIGRWEQTIRAALPELVSIRVADVTDEPPPSYEKVAEMLRERVPENVSVLIDLQSHWATSYALDTGQPCLVLFDGDHHVVAKFRGRPKGELVDEVMDALRDYFPAVVES